MSNLYPIQNSFAAGELAPSLYGRSDLAKYSVGLKRCENMVIHPHGGVSKRGGMRKAVLTKYQNKKCIVAKFQFSLSQRFELEIGDKYIRFIDNNGAQVMDPSNTTVPYEIVSPYAEADLSGLSFAQSADIIYITHNDYPPYELVRVTNTNWTLVKFPYKSGPFLPKPVSQEDISLTLNDIRGTVTVTASDSLFVAEHVGTIFSITHHVDGISMKTQGNASGIITTVTLKKKTTYYDTYQSGDHDRSRYKVHYFATDAQITNGTFAVGSIFVESETVSYTVTGIGSLTGDGRELFVSPVPGLSYSSFNKNISVKITNTDTVWGAEVTAYTHWSLESNGFWGGTVRLQRWSNDEDRWTNMRTYESPIYADGTTTTSAAKNFSDSGEVDEPTQLRLVSDNFFAYKPNGNGEADRGYFILTVSEAKHTGYMKITAVANATSATAVMETDAADTRATLLWQEGAWGEKSGYPAASGFLGERICFGNTPTEPESYWLSRVGDYYDFGPSSPIQDDDPITGTLTARQISRIHHFIALNDLIAMTDSSEWVISSGATGSVMTPTNTMAKTQGYRGCANIDPIVIGNIILYVQSQGARVRDLGYSFESDNYTGNDLTVLASHLFKDHKIVDWCFAQEPDSMCWIVRDDGALVSLTYLREHDVIAWARHPLPGEGRAESITSIRTETGDDVYLVINRSGVRTIEYMSPTIISTDPEEAFFLDGGVTVRGTNVTSVTGLAHLNGQTVSIVADGSVLSDQVVTNGAVTLPSAASVVHVGLPYAALIETLDLNIPRRDGSQLGRKLRVSACILQYEDSRGLFVGTDEDHMSEQVDRTNEASGEPTKLKSGYYKHTLDSGYDSGSIIVKAPYPMPASVLSLTPVVDTVAAFN